MSEKMTATGGKSGIGAGSASIILIFAVLCLTIFTLITYIVAGNYKALVDIEAELVLGYYNADAQAERILAEILKTAQQDSLPDTIFGAEISTKYDETLRRETISFYCPVSDMKALYVNIAINRDSYDILSWRMTDLDEWQSDQGINVWTGG